MPQPPKRIGPAGILFEHLTLQAGFTFEAACAIIQRTHGHSIDAAAFEVLAARHSALARRKTVALKNVEHSLAGSADPSSALLAQCHRVESEWTMAVLAREVDALPAIDRALVRRRFFGNASIASLARDTHQDATLIYRRLARLMTVLRQRLEHKGVTGLYACALIHDLTC